MSALEPWAYYNRIYGLDPSTLSYDQRLVQAIGELREDVNSGGFDLYLRHRDRRNALVAAEAARAVGCPELADLIDEAIALVGSELLAPEHDETVEGWLDHIEDDLDQLDQRFYELEETLNLDAAMSRLVARVT